MFILQESLNWTTKTHLKWYFNQVVAHYVIKQQQQQQVFHQKQASRCIYQCQWLVLLPHKKKEKPNVLSDLFIWS